MRVIIEPDYQKLSQWAANYVASKINAETPLPKNHSYWVVLPVHRH